MFECFEDKEVQSSRLLHGPCPVSTFIHGGPPAVTAAVGPLETVNWMGDGQWKRSEIIYLLYENLVWEWDVNSGHTRRTIRSTTLRLDSFLDASRAELAAETAERTASSASVKAKGL